MPICSVAIVGRPNVGKSSLLNFLAGRRISIVDPTAGVTRDRIATLIEHSGRRFELVDTGGFGVTDSDNLSRQVEEQIQLAMQSASLLLFVVDIRTGLTPADKQAALMVRSSNRPVLLVVNKADSSAMERAAADFYAMGFAAPIMVSCRENRGRVQLLDAIVENLPADPDSAISIGEPEIKLAIVGKRNAGKSSLVNALAGQPRVIVSEIPGTTRDSVDVRIESGGRSLIVIDTAGVRKKARMTASDLEFYAFHRAQRSIRRADVVLLLIDATVSVGDVDKKLTAYITQEHKPLILGFNKWDLVQGRASPEEFASYIGKLLPQAEYAPVVCLSAKDNDNLDQTVQLAFTLHAQAGIRLSTGQLNQAVEDILRQRGPSSPTSQVVKVYYATQTSTCPPEIVLFVNNPQLITEEYRRYFVRQLRQRTSLTEVPIKLVVRSHHRRATPDNA